MTDTATACRLIQVHSLDAAVRQWRLWMMLHVSTAVLDEHLHRPIRQPSNVPFSNQGDVTGGEIGTRMARLEARIIALRLQGELSPEQLSTIEQICINPDLTPADQRRAVATVRMAATRTPEQARKLTELEAQHRALCAEADSMPRRGNSSGRIGSYTIRIPTLEIRVSEDLQRYETAEIHLDLADAPAYVRGAHDALLAAYGPGGVVQGAVWDKPGRGRLEACADLDPLLIRYWSMLAGWAEIVLLGDERRRAA